MSIQFRDLQRQYDHIKSSIDSRIQSVITSAHFISGPECTCALSLSILCAIYAINNAFSMTLNS